MKNTGNVKKSIIVENLNNEFLSNINFSLNAGTFTAIIGKSGSGKTLLLKCLAGLLEHSGTVKFDDSVITKSFNKDIGIYLGTINLNNDTVFSNILEPLNNLDVSLEKSKKKVYDITKKLGIDNLIHKNINTLSFGEKKVVAFAKSIVHTPNIIFLDNIFDGLDTNYKNTIVKYLTKLKKEKNISVLFTTNDSENLMLADNIIVLNKGEIVSKGTREELFKDSNVFIKNKLKLPFIIDLSNKLESYELTHDLVYSIPEMVDKLWK